MAMCQLCRRNLLAGERFRPWRYAGRDATVCVICEPWARRAGMNRCRCRQPCAAIVDLHVELAVDRRKVQTSRIERGIDVVDRRVARDIRIPFQPLAGAENAIELEGQSASHRVQLVEKAAEHFIARTHQAGDFTAVEF